MSIDKFYSNKTIAKMVHEIAISRGCSNYIEPSAGNGSISLLFDRIASFDIEPEHESIESLDWFEYPVPLLPSTCVVGNPPFGKRSKLAIDFINHSFKIGAEQVVFILPNVFKKHTIQSRITKDAFLSMQVDLPDNGFLYEGKPYHVPTCIQVWQKDLRVVKGSETSDLFEFSNKEDCTFFMFGAGGRLIHPSDVKDTNRGYYIKCNDEVKKMFEKIDWTGHSSVPGGVTWVTKSEVVQKLNDYLQEK